MNKITDEDEFEKEVKRGGDLIFREILKMIRQGNEDEAADYLFQNALTAYGANREVVDVLGPMIEGMWDKGHYQAAESLLYRVIEFTEKEISKNDPFIEKSLHWISVKLNSLALRHYEKREYLIAEKIFFKSLNAESKARGQNNRDFATVTKNLGFLYYNKDDYQRAEKYFIKARGIFRKTKTVNGIDYAQCLTGLAFLHMNKGKYNKAEELLKQSEKIISDSVGVRDPQYGYLMLNLAKLYKMKGDTRKAEWYSLKSQDVLSSIGTKKHYKF